MVIKCIKLVIIIVIVLFRLILIDLLNDEMLNASLCEDLNYV